MKTFYVTVRTRRVRAVSVTKFISVADTAEKAVELVKNYYPPECTGWPPNAEFVVESEIPANSVKIVG